MASGSYAISGLQLGDPKREFQVRANRKTARAGDVIKFTITATGVSDRTIRSYYLSKNFGPDKIVGGKTNGLFYLRQGKAEVYVQIAEDYDSDKDEKLTFSVIDSKSALFRIKRPPSADVTIKGDGLPNDEERRQKQLRGRNNKQIRGKNSKALPPGKGGLARQDPIYPVSVREVAPKALKSGTKALPGITGQRSLPPGAPRGLPGSAAPKALPPAGMKALPGAGTPSILPASQQVIDVTPTTVSRSSGSLIGTRDVPNIRQVSAKYGLDAPAPKPAWGPPKAGGGALAKGGTAAGGGALAKGGTAAGGGALAKAGTAAGGGALAKGGATALKGVKAGPAALLTAGMEFGSRMDSGQNVVQAGVGTAASTAGGIVGASKGAAVGAALGSVVPGLGTAIGGLLGAVIGGFGGSMLAGGVADAATGANRQEFAEGAHIVPKMTDMPFNMPGLSGSFNEPGNPEMMSITPLDDPGKALQSISGIASMVPGLGGIGAMGSMLGGMGSLFGGKPKEYEGIAKAIGKDLEDRGIGDPFGLKGSNKSFGNMTRDLFATAMGESLKKIFGGLFGGNNGGNTGGTTPGSTSPVSGQASGDMKKGAEMIKSAGVPTRGAAYLAGNIQQESSWNGQRDWGQVMGDGTSRNGGLVSWASWANDPARLGKIEGYLGKNIKEASDGEQINAMLWEMKNDYPGAYKVFMDPNSTDAQLKQASKDYWGYGHEGMRYDYAQQALQHLQQSPVQMGQQQMMQASDFKEYDLESNEANSVVRMADNSLYRTNDRGAITDQRVTLGEANQIMQAKRQQQDTYQTSQIRSGFQQVSYNPSIVPMSSPSGGSAGGTVIEYLTGDPNHMGYRADHAGNNYHEHLAFRTVEEKERAKAALVANGIQIGSELRPGDTDSYHSMGLALDVPAAQVPVGQEPALSRRVREILAANGFSGKGIGSSTGMQQPTGSPMQMNPGFQQMSAQPAQPQGNPEDFFAFAAAAQGMQYSPPAGANTSANNLMQTSAQTTMASNRPAVTVVNTPVSSTNVTQGGGGQVSSGSQAGGSMSDSGLLSYIARQQLMTIGA